MSSHAPVSLCSLPVVMLSLRCFVLHFFRA
jgi:hypothetical protein